MNANGSEEETTATKDPLGLFKTALSPNQVPVLREAAFRRGMKSLPRTTVSAPRPCPQPVLSRRARGLQGGVEVRPKALPGAKTAAATRPPDNPVPRSALPAQASPGPGRRAGKPRPPPPRLCPPVLPHGDRRAGRHRPPPPTAAVRPEGTRAAPTGPSAAPAAALTSLSRPSARFARRVTMEPARAQPT